MSAQECVPFSDLGGIVKCVCFLGNHGLINYVVVDQGEEGRKKEGKKTSIDQGSLGPQDMAGIM